MDENTPVLALAVDAKHSLAVYAYSYHMDMRLTISLENDDSVFSSVHIRPVFCPFTGKRAGTSSEDVQSLVQGISLRGVNGKMLLRCCRLEGSCLILQKGEEQVSLSLPYDMLTGKKYQ